MIREQRIVIASVAHATTITAAYRNRNGEFRALENSCIDCGDPLITPGKKTRRCKVCGAAAGAITRQKLYGDRPRKLTAKEVLKKFRDADRNPSDIYPCAQPVDDRHPRCSGLFLKIKPGQTHCQFCDGIPGKVSGRSAGYGWTTV